MDTRGDGGSSNTKLLATGLGLGALVMVALSSRRGRQALAAAADKAAQLGRRAPPAPAQGVRQLSSTADGRTTRYGIAQDGGGGALQAASGALQQLADRANELAYGWTSRARRLSAQARSAASRHQADAARSARRAPDDEITHEMEWVARRVPGRAMLLVAASVGALYAVQRYGLAGRLREAVGRGPRGERPLSAPAQRLGAAPPSASAQATGAPDAAAGAHAVGTGAVAPGASLPPR